MRKLLICLVIALPAVSRGFELKKDESGSPVSWRGNVEFVFDSRASELLGEPQAFAAAKAALETLAAAIPGYTISIREGATNPIGYDASPGAHNQNQVVVETTWQYPLDATAKTFLTVDAHSHKILHADIVLNAQYRKFKVLPPDSVPGGEYDDLQNILTHEFGHAFGLEHNPTDPRVVMYAIAATGEVIKRTLAEDDKAGLHALYPNQEEQATSNGKSPQVGCTSFGGQPSVWLALVALSVLFTLHSRKRVNLSNR